MFSLDGSGRVGYEGLAYHGRMGELPGCYFMPF